MSKEADTRIIYKGNAGYLYIPYRVVLDSAYPFERDEVVEVKIKIEDKKLVVSKE
jgi:hypothetical protein